MASYYKLKSGLWRAQIEKLGVRDSGSFERKPEAIAWATTREAEIIDLHAKKRLVSQAGKTVKQALNRYLEEVTPTKRGKGPEGKRILAFLREPWVALDLSDLDATDFTAWKNKRLQAVTPGSVQRDVNLLKAIFNVARKEWKWMSHDPFEGFKNPGQNEPRKRRVRPHEVKLMCRELSWRSHRTELDMKNQELAIALLIALRTAMRQGEILRLTTKTVNLKACTAFLPHTSTKTGKARTVPLSPDAKRLIGMMVTHARAEKRENLFTLDSKSADALWRKARARVMKKQKEKRVPTEIDALHFHDSRAEATTRLAKRLNPYELARVTGHSDIEILMETYYREDPAEIAQRMGRSVPGR